MKKLLLLIITAAIAYSAPTPEKEALIPIEEWVQRLHLEPLIPEGGFFAQHYRSSESIAPSNLPSRYPGTRRLGTAIYFLLTSDNFSAFHRNKSDEIWHYYYGSPVQCILINADGTVSKPILGTYEGEPQVIIPESTWFAAIPLEKNSYSLVGCTMAPGFDYDDFELAQRNELIREFPQHQTIIEQFTRS